MLRDMLRKPYEVRTKHNHSLVELSCGRAPPFELREASVGSHGLDM